MQPDEQANEDQNQQTPQVDGQTPFQPTVPEPTDPVADPGQVGQDQPVDEPATDDTGVEEPEESEDTAI